MSAASPAGTCLSVGAAAWAGAIAGVSFLATPAKFLVPALPFAVAMQVGQTTFGLFQAAEIALLALAALLVALRPARGQGAGAVAALAVAVAVQQLLLTPAMDARIAAVLAAAHDPSSSLCGAGGGERRPVRGAGRPALSLDTGWPERLARTAGQAAGGMRPGGVGCSSRRRGDLHAASHCGKWGLAGARSIPQKASMSVWQAGHAQSAWNGPALDVTVIRT